MRHFVRLGLTLGLVLVTFVALPSAAQTNQAPPDRWQITLDQQRYVWDVRLVKLAGDTLIVRQRDSLIGTPIARITEMRLLPETILLVGDGHHSAISAMAGSNPNVFDLARLNVTERRKTIQKILARHSRGD